MSAKLKLALHGVVNLAGNGIIFTVIPDPYKDYVILAFNVIQLILAFIDPSYTMQLIQTGQLAVPPEPSSSQQ